MLFEITLTIIYNFCTEWVAVTAVTIAAAAETSNETTLELSVLSP